MSTRRIAVAGFAALSIAALALPAQADTTTTTFSLTAGSLSIDAPATTALGSFASGSVSSVSGALGETVVSDTRGALAAAHVVTFSSGDFKTGGGTVTETIAGSTVLARSGAVSHTNTTAGAVEVETLTDVPSGSTLASYTGYTGNDEARYNPTVTIPILTTNVAGTYTGVITQTVVAV